jgi:hypothetical protein
MDEKGNLSRLDFKPIQSECDGFARLLHFAGHLDEIIAPSDKNWLLTGR